MQQLLNACDHIEARTQANIKKISNYYEQLYLTGYSLNLYSTALNYLDHFLNSQRILTLTENADITITLNSTKNNQASATISRELFFMPIPSTIIPSYGCSQFTFIDLCGIATQVIGNRILAFEEMLFSETDKSNQEKMQYIVKHLGNLSLLCALEFSTLEKYMPDMEILIERKIIHFENALKMFIMNENYEKALEIQFAIINLELDRMNSERAIQWINNVLNLVKDNSTAESAINKLLLTLEKTMLKQSIEQTTTNINSNQIIQALKKTIENIVSRFPETTDIVILFCYFRSQKNLTI